MTIYFLLCLIALQVVDWWTTRRVLALGGRELNPIVRWLMDRLGETAGLVAAKAFVVALAIAGALLMGRHAIWPLAALCGLYAVVVSWNLRAVRLLNSKNAGDVDNV